MQKDPASVIHALSTAWLNDYNTLHMGLPLKTIWKLQLGQNEQPAYLIGAQNTDFEGPSLVF